LIFFIAYFLSLCRLFLRFSSDISGFHFLRRRSRWLSPTFRYFICFHQRVTGFHVSSVRFSASLFFSLFAFSTLQQSQCILIVISTTSPGIFIFSHCRIFQISSSASLPQRYVAFCRFTCIARPAEARQAVNSQLRELVPPSDIIGLFLFFIFHHYSLCISSLAKMTRSSLSSFFDSLAVFFAAISLSVIRLAFFRQVSYFRFIFFAFVAFFQMPYFLAISSYFTASSPD